ncbi:MAG TPA: phosphatidylglycerol lysyltransferase domain-containing protein [Ktedonobacterales bacterium]|nr:phosphatidylglycerol lysyltransferase domain-containing protein [Ktedonobacterales bacterium]
MLAHHPHVDAHPLTRAGRIVFALLLAVAALANLATLLLASPWQQAVAVERVVDLDGLGWGREGALAAGLLLLLVARALARGKRHAWFLAVVLLGFSLASVRISRAHFSYTPLMLGLLIALLALAPLFPARSDPKALRRGYAALLLSTALFVFHNAIRQFWHTRAPLAVREAMTPGPHAAVLLLLRILLFLFLGYGVVEVLRPVLRARRQRRDEQAHVRAIVARCGTATAAHFALAADKTYFWSDSRRAVLAYRLVGGVALALGDPIGPDEELEPLLLAFLAFCKRQDWTPVLYLATPRVQVVCHAWNLHAYKVGEEGIVTATEFSTAGKASAPVRHSVTRARKDGISVRIFRGEPIPEAIWAGMRRVSAAWMELQGTRAQMGFSMGRFPSDWSPELVTAVALAPHGEVQAFLTWTPLYQGNGWSLDNMRRLPDMVPGTMEMLIAESINWARERGYARMSIGLAPLAGLDSTLEHDLSRAAYPEAHTGVEASAARPGGARASRQDRLSWLERSAGSLYRRKLLLGNYATLYHFKAKFRPEWQPRYLVVTDTAALPKVLLGLMRAQGYTLPHMLSDAAASVRPRLRSLATRRGIHIQPPASASSQA